MDKIKKLRSNFEGAVNAYVDAFLELFELDKANAWWVRDRIGLDAFCFNDLHAIGLDEMVYCVENDIKYDEFLEYEEYNVRCSEFNLPTLNLESWHKGAPRVPQERFDHLDELKKELNEQVDKIKEQF